MRSGHSKPAFIKSSLSKTVLFLTRYEVASLIIVGVLSLLPLFTSRYFVTMDGPAHLYNAKLIGYLLNNSNPIIAEFYSLNSLMPNTISHLLLAGLMTFMPAFLAEKTLIVLYLFSFVFSFRYLLISANGNALFTFLIFPFIYSFPFLLGFYNFSFGVVFLFFTLGLWVRNANTNHSIRYILGLSFLLFLTFTSHLFIFALVLLLIGLFILNDLLFKRDKPLIVSLYKPLLILAVSTAIPIYFAVKYFQNRPIANSDFEFLNKTDLLTDLAILRPLIAYNFRAEVFFTILIGSVLLGLLLFALFGRNLRQKTDLNNLSRNYYWSFILLILLGLYFFFPNSDGRGSFISMRIGLLFYPFLIVWLSRSIKKNTVVIPAIGILICAHMVLVLQYAKYSRDLSQFINGVVGATNYIPEGSVVAVAKETDIWVAGHYSGYIGLEKPIVILDNYEANYGYFPVVWKENEFPSIKLFETPIPANDCMLTKTNSNGDDYQADFLFILGNAVNLSNKCPEWGEYIDSPGAENVYSTDYATLIKLKK